MKRLMFLLSSVVAFSNISAQGKKSFFSRFVPNTVDIRSIGMGKTEAATNSGSNALFTNPYLHSKINRIIKHRNIIRRLILHISRLHLLKTLIPVIQPIKALINQMFRFMRIRIPISDLSGILFNKRQANYRGGLQ